MTSCPSDQRAPFSCPALLDSILATAALLPRGRAWPANDGGGTISNFLAWLAGLGSTIPAPSDWPPGYVQAGFVAALGTVRNWVEAQFCALKDEFFCATASQTLDLWNAEYGLPDQCDPFPNLCAKVATVGGGAAYGYLISVAAALGWSISCAFTAPAEITIYVYLSQSPSYQAVAGAPPLAGLLLAGQRLTCPPDISQLTCAFDRIVQAHLAVTYTTVS